MEERDQYQGDYSRKYYPKDDIGSYAKYLNLMGGKPRYLSAVRKEDIDKTKVLMNENGTLNIATFVLSLLPVIFYKKIPWIRNFRSTFGRVMWSLAFLMVPSMIVSTYANARFAEFLQRRYTLRASAFSTYKQTGDILKINDEVKIVDS